MTKIFNDPAVLANGGSGRRYEDWSRLVGLPVEIRKDFRVVRAGVVDDAMQDSSALWLAADAAGGRALFTAAEGYEAWISPRELGGKLCYKMASAQLDAPQRTSRP